MIKPLVLGTMLFAAPLHAEPQQPLPIMDVHLHAKLAGAQGPPPLPQKRDILYDAAARFLRLSEAEIARHHGRAARPGNQRLRRGGAHLVEGDGEGRGAPVTWVRERVESTNRRSPMVMTVLEARVASERWEDLQASYAERARLSEEGPVLESFLVQDDDDPDTWRIVTVWRDRESLEAMRASGETPTGVLIFRDADAEPRLSIFTVFANPRAAADSTP